MHDPVEEICYGQEKEAYFFEWTNVRLLLYLFWCGREDLNLHEIAPASTSKYLTEFHRVSPVCLFNGLHGFRCRPV
jgi:hypothetical protein